MRSEKELEMVARRFCKEMGIDPDETTAHGPRWQVELTGIRRDIALFDIFCNQAHFDGRP